MAQLVYPAFQWWAAAQVALGGLLSELRKPPQSFRRQAPTAYRVKDQPPPVIVRYLNQLLKLPVHGTLGSCQAREEFSEP